METWRAELYHHGILGQRWGQRNGPPYPLGPGDHSAAEKRKNKSLGQMFAERKKKKARAKALEKARVQRAKNAEEKRKQEEHEANREKVMKSGKASEVLKYKDEMTNQELQYQIDRLQKIDTLKSLSAKEVKTGFDKMDSTMKKIGKITNYAETLTKAYNAGAKVANAFAEANLPIVGEGKKKNGNKNKNKDQNKEN